MRGYSINKQFCERLGIQGYVGGTSDAEVNHETVLAAICTIAAQLQLSHTTELTNGIVKARFANSRSIEIAGEVTPDQLFSYLVQSAVEVHPYSGKFTVNYSLFSTRGQRSCNDVTEIQNFLNDPMAFVPDNLKPEIVETLTKKAKAINKCFRNYDSENAKRNKGKRYRAVASLSEQLATLDPHTRSIAVSVVRTDTDRASLEKLIAVLKECAKNRHNWHDEDVITEASDLAEVKWTMNQ
jgi:hypothetical protein